MKTCFTCREEFTEDNFYKKTQSRDGLNANCIQCVKTYQSTPRKSKKRMPKKYSDEYRRNYLDSIREETPCLDCKRFFPACAMDFDHMPGYQKSFGIMSRYRYIPWERVLEEIKKCEIVCAVCHRIRTASRR